MYHLPCTIALLMWKIVQDLLSNTTVTYEPIWVVVGVYAMDCGMIHPYQTWSIPHIILKNYMGIAYPYADHYPWTPTPLLRYMVQALLSENQGNI